MKNIIYVLLVLVLLISACTQLIKKEMPLYTNKEYSFTMNYPQDWVKEEIAGEAPVIVFVSPKENEQDKFIENMNIGVGELDKEISIEQFKKESLIGLKTMFPDIQLASETPTKLGGSAGYFIEYKVEDGKYTFVQAFTIKEKTAYMLSSATETSKYPQFKPVIESIFNSFTFV